MAVRGIYALFAQPLTAHLCVRIDMRSIAVPVPIFRMRQAKIGKDVKTDQSIQGIRISNANRFDCPIKTFLADQGVDKKHIAEIQNRGRMDRFRSRKKKCVFVQRSIFLCFGVERKHVPFLCHRQYT